MKRKEAMRAVDREGVREGKRIVRNQHVKRKQQRIITKFATK